MEKIQYSSITGDFLFILLNKSAANQLLKHTDTHMSATKNAIKILVIAFEFNLFKSLRFNCVRREKPQRN